MKYSGDKAVQLLTLFVLLGGCVFPAEASAAAAKPAAPAAAAAKKPAPPQPASSTPDPAPAPVPVVDQAYAAYEKKDYAQARALAEEEAGRGVPSAHTLLGQLYEYGLGVPKDEARAAEWYSKGAGLGDLNAEFLLGMMFVEGRGVAKDKKRAGRFFELAAAKNHPQAQYNLALLYAEGVVYPQDYAKVAMWLQKAAEQNNPQAEYDLASMYNSGTGLPKDEAKGEYWVSMAAKEGHRDAELDYALILLRRGMPVKGKETSIDATRRVYLDEGVKYLRTSAEKGNPVAQSRLAKAYVDGFFGSLERDPVMAAKWHLIARVAGVTDGRLDLFLTTLTPDQRRRADRAAEEWRADAIGPAPQ